MKCTLDEDINTCQFFKREILKCGNEGKCSFQEEDETKINREYTRENRWYEQYYKKKD